MTRQEQTRKEKERKIRKDEFGKRRDNRLQWLKARRGEITTIKIIRFDDAQYMTIVRDKNIQEEKKDKLNQNEVRQKEKMTMVSSEEQRAALSKESSVCY